MAFETFYAPAKVNLYLEVLRRRPDGYHDLSMIMQRISLYDRIDISLGGDPGIRVVCEGVPLGDGEENIAARAAKRIQDLSGERVGVDIRIEKKIPVAAGLGGGSSDAASVLLGLNDMLRLGLSRELLMKEGGALGADVPFFVLGRTAWAREVGDVLEEIDGLPPLWYVLVNPGVAVSTAWVYQNLRLTSTGGEAKLPGFFGTPRGVASLLRNDLESVTVERYPVIDKIKGRLKSAGALGALMSGSGPTVFGIFEEEEEARKACDLFGGSTGWKVFLAHSL